MKATKTNIVFALMCIMLLTGCGSKHKSDYIIINSEQTEEKKPEVIASEKYHFTDTISWRGKVYNYTVSRESDKEAPVAIDEEGQKFYDNKVMVTILRSDNTEFYSHTFRKSAFSDYIPASFAKGSILEGIVFEKAEEGYLQFAASVAYPQTDEYIPFAIRISPNGSITIVKVNQLEEERPE